MMKLKLAPTVLIAELTLAALLTACGGGSGDPAAPGQTSVEGDSSGTTEVANPKLKLSNLPREQTTQRTASIFYTVESAAANTVVRCRLNSYAPIECPNPFVLGSRTELKEGTHSVDYYLDSGSGINVSQPDLSYSWTIAASDAGDTATPPTSSDPTPTPPVAAGALAAAPVPANTAVSGYSGQWDGVTTIATSGATMQRVVDPSGSGRMVNLHRVKRGGTEIWGGVRSEQLWNNKPAQALTPGKDIWMAFAVQRKADETFGPSEGEHLVFQTHTPQSGATQPDIALFADAQANMMGWRVAYNTSGNVDSKGWMSTEGNPWVHKEPPPAPGVWYRYVVHYRPGYLTSHNPLLEIWRAKPGGAYDKIVTHTGFNTYNTSKTGAGASYPRIGLYHYEDSWSVDSIAWYLTPLYFGTGADLLEAGKAALNDF